MQAVLTALKDIPGVVGSFVLTPQGALLAREMPSIFPDSTFPELGRRLASIAEALETQMSAVHELLLKYDGHWLFARRMTHGILTILTSDSVNFPALKMAANVAAKQIAEPLATAFAIPAVVAPAAAVPPPIPQPGVVPVAAVAEPALAPVPVAPARPRRMWRGQIVD